MRVPAKRPRLLAVGIAVLTAAALGTVSASAVQSSDAPGTRSAGGHAARGKGGSALVFGYRPTAAAPADVNGVNDDFAACMSRHGATSVPVFHATKDANGKTTLEISRSGPVKGLELSPKKFQKALKSCAPILKEVGISVSTNTSDLPPLPNPNTHGKPGRSGHTKDDGQPGLTTSLKEA
ncbi:hypothetical protein ACQEWB_35175 [Streptomyces sp. CA-249302]|uniref:hypothetical protein n=1 Tax=Streptomyces sp. CA-249302 TaxID=3240058 RepID=UPI003D8D48A1